LARFTFLPIRKEGKDERRKGVGEVKILYLVHIGHKSFGLPSALRVSEIVLPDHLLHGNKVC